MEIILYKNLDSDNQINKNLSDPKSIPIRLKRDIDIIRPEIVLSVIPDVDYLEYNYCHIPLLNRFYFIDSVESINNKMYVFRCTCDVLETYKSDVLNTKARLKRSIKNGDYMSVQIDESVIKSISLHNSNVQIGTDETIILTSVGE